MGQRESKLDKKDKQIQQQFQLGVAVLFLNTSSNNDLYQSLNSINKEVRSLLQDVEDEAVELADADTEQFTKFTAKPNNNKTRRAAVAMGVVSVTVYAIEVKLNDSNYHQAVQEALMETEYRRNLTASTEFFTKYNTQYINNLANLKGYWEWNAQLDKRTCAKCAGLAGRQWDNQDDIPSIPLHPRCRCILDFYPV